MPRPKFMLSQQLVLSHKVVLSHRVTMVSHKVVLSRKVVLSWQALFRVLQVVSRRTSGGCGRRRNLGTTNTRKSVFERYSYCMGVARIRALPEASIPKPEEGMTQCMRPPAKFAWPTHHFPSYHPLILPLSFSPPVSTLYTTGKVYPLFSLYPPPPLPNSMCNDRRKYVPPHPLNPLNSAFLP